MPKKVAVKLGACQRRGRGEGSDRAHLFLKQMSWAPRPHRRLQGSKAYRSGSTPHIRGSSSLHVSQFRASRFVDATEHSHPPRRIVASFPSPLTERGEQILASISRVDHSHRDVVTSRYEPPLPPRPLPLIQDPQEVIQAMRLHRVKAVQKHLAEHAREPHDGRGPKPPQGPRRLGQRRVWGWIHRRKGGEGLEDG